MIRTMIELLEYVKADTEVLKIAKGRYYLPKRFKDISKVCLK